MMSTPESLGEQLFPYAAGILSQTSDEAKQARKEGHYATMVIVGAFGLVMTGIFGALESFEALPRLMLKGVEAIDAWGEKPKIAASTSAPQPEDRDHSDVI